MQESILDQVPKLVELLVILTLFLTIYFWRDYWLHPLIFRLLYNRIGVVSFVGEKMFCRDALD